MRVAAGDVGRELEPRGSRAEDLGIDERARRVERQRIAAAPASLHVEVAGDLALILRRVDRRDVEAVTDLLEVEIGDVSPGGVLGCGAAADGERTGRPLRDGGVPE